MIYTKQLLSIRVDPPKSVETIVLAGPVPAGRSWILRDVEVFAYRCGAGTDYADLTIVKPGPVNLIWWCWYPPSTPDACRQWAGRLALNAGETLRARVLATAGIFNVVVTGYDLAAA